MDSPTVVQLASVILGFLWLVSSSLKTLSFAQFRADVEALLGGHSGRSIGVFVIGMEIAASAMLFFGFSKAGGPFSASLVIAFTASYILRATTLRNLQCACFGSLSKPRFLARLGRTATIAADSAAGAWVFVRNSLFIVLAAAVSGYPPLITALLVSTIATLMVVATLTETLLELEDRKKIPHPALSDLLARRRIIFATDWYSGVWTSWISCFESKKSVVN